MGHFYDKDGEPRYEVPYANGKGLRDSTLADAKKNGWAPSVTTLFQQLAKPGLDFWKQGQLLDAVTQVFDPKDFYWREKAVALSKQKGGDAAKRGSELHDALETYFKDGTVSQENREWVSPVIAKLFDKFPNYQWVAEESFYHPLHFGGKVDLHCKNPMVVLDFKTKDTDDIKKMKGWTEHRMQLAAYREGLRIPDALCYNLFISTQVPGLVVLEEYTSDEMAKAWEMFKCLNRYWQLDNNVGIQE